MIELKWVKQQDRTTIRAVSQVLNSGLEKLDCREVYNLEPEQLDALFSSIRPEWRKWQELENFIDIDNNTFHEDLGMVINDYLRNPSPPPPETPENIKNEVTINLKLLVLAIICFLGGGLVTTSLPYFMKSKLQSDSLTIGTLYKVEKQAELADYLRKELVPDSYIDFLKGKKIKVIINGDQTISYQEAQNRMQAKEWDIAFAMSPINSIFAENHDYSFLGKMFPNSKTYQSGLFVKRDSKINSIDDIKPTTVVALGGFNSASSFYMPVYDLYGKTLTAKTGNRGSKIVEMVKNGQADVGAAAIGDSLRDNDNELRIIHQSREIPSSGVYLSPELSLQDRETIKQLMLDAPKQVKEQSNYDAGQKPDFTNFQKIIQKVDLIALCEDFKKSQVNLFCPAGFNPTIIQGKVNGWSAKTNSYILKLISLNGEIFHVFVTPQILEQTTGITDAKDLQGKIIQIKLKKKPERHPNGTLSFEVSQDTQINILKTAM